MPLYDYVCQNGHRQTRLRKIAGRNYPAICRECGCRAKFTISAPAVNCWDPSWRFNHMRATGDGMMSFPSEKAYRDHMVKLGCHEHALGIKEI